MTKAVLAVLILVVGGLAAWLYWSPRHAAQQLQKAARTNDTATVARLVDFPKVREQLIADVESTRTVVRQAIAGQNIDKALERLSQSASPLAWSLVGPRNEMSIMQVTSPTGFAALIRTGGSTFQTDAPPDSAQVSMKHLKYPRTFQVVMVNPTPPANQPFPDTLRLLLERKGLAWQVKQARTDLNLCKAGCEVQVEGPR